MCKELLTSSFGVPAPWKQKSDHNKPWKFHKEMKRTLPALNLKDTQFLTATQKMINLCTTLQNEKNLEFETAYQEAFYIIKDEVFSKKQAFDNESSNIASTFKAALEKRTQNEQPISINIKDVMSDK